MDFLKKFLISSLIVGGVAVFGLAGFLLAYDTAPTHPVLAEKSARIFNQYYGGSLSESDIREIAQGSINEDTPPRWINHFYDPTTGMGWNAERMGDLPPSVLRQISLVGLSSAGVVSAPNWARNQRLQESYRDYEGNQTFEKAVYDYVNGDKKSAYRALGHILHLVEDMTVPAHTRQDTHYEAAGDPGEPYEKWAKENTDLSHLSNLNLDKENFHCFDLNDCFNKLANYSNNNFFSEDTIWDEAYFSPVVDRYKAIDRYTKYGFSTNNQLLLKVFVNPGSGFIERVTVQDDKIHFAYWQKLSTKAVLGGAEVIRIFHEEAAKAEKDKNLLESLPLSASWFTKSGIIAAIGPGAPTPIFSAIGALNKALDWAKGAVSFIGSKTNSLSASLLSLFGGGGADQGNLGNQDDRGDLGDEGIVNDENNSPQPSLASRGGEGDEDSPIVNIVPDSFSQISLNNNPSTRTAPKASAGQASSGNTNLPQISADSIFLEGEQTGSEEILPNPPFTKEGNAQQSGNNIGGQTSIAWGAGAAAGGADDVLEALPETYATSTLFYVNPSTGSGNNTGSENNTVVATTTAVFEFSSNEDGATFECSLDQATSTVCISPIEYNNLSDGDHSFSVTAISPAGQKDEIPAIFNWTVDATPPDVSLSIENHKLTSINFDVVWNSSSSDIVSYEIQYRVGEGGVWQEFAQASEPGQKSFQATRDDTIYHFRARGIDNLENEGPWKEIQAEISLNPVVINEIAWMGTGANYRDEWIELYNKTGQDIDLSGWILGAIDGNPSIVLTGVIPAHEYFLLERTDDQTIQSVVADLIYSGNGVSQNMLGNGGEWLELKDPTDNLIDSVLSSSKWFAGIASPEYRTMERINPYLAGNSVENWATNDGITINGLDADGNQINGTPKAPNSQFNHDFSAPTVIFGKTTISRDTIWTLQGSPYILRPQSVSNYLTISDGATLIIEPGVVVKPAAQIQPNLVVRGRLLALGTESQPILFTSVQDSPKAGDWGSIIFEEESRGSVIDNVIFEYGGYKRASAPETSYPMVKINKSGVRITNSRFGHAQDIALYLIDSASEISFSDFSDNNYGVVIDGLVGQPTIFSCEFGGIENRGDGRNYQNTGIHAKNGAKPLISSNDFIGFQYPILISGASPLFLGNQMQDNVFNGAVVHWQSRFFQDTIWQGNLTYILISNAGNDHPTVASGTVLTIRPGTVVKPVGRSYMALEIEGRLVAEGTEAEPIIFTAFKDDSFGGDANNDEGASVPEDDDLDSPANLGEWNKVVFEAGSSGSLSHIRFKYGGYVSASLPHNPLNTFSIDDATEVVFGDGVVLL